MIDRWLEILSKPKVMWTVADDVLLYVIPAVIVIGLMFVWWVFGVIFEWLREKMNKVLHKKIGEANDAEDKSAEDSGDEHL